MQDENPDCCRVGKSRDGLNTVCREGGIETIFSCADQTNRRPVPAGTGASARTTTIEACEREHILQALGETGWIVGGRNGAAALLGVTRTTLNWKMQKLGIARNATLSGQGDGDAHKAENFSMTQERRGQDDWPRFSDESGARRLQLCALEFGHLPLNALGDAKGVSSYQAVFTTYH